MKRNARYLIVATAILCIAIAVLVLSGSRDTPQNGKVARITGPQDGTMGTPPPRPAKFFHFKHEPTSPEEHALWDWWFYMDKHDPSFQWKTPISFYGRVVDQHSLPVIGARVFLDWNSTTGSRESETTSDGEGKFELTGATGKALTVQVGKDGYVRYLSTQRGFEYSAFWDDTYYVAYKANPVLFKLWKLEDTEPMYFWHRTANVNVDGEKLWFDTKSGQFGPNGDAAFSTRRGAIYGPRQFDWSMVVDAATGGGLVMSADELMFEAPESGYQQSWEKQNNGKDSSFNLSEKFRFYLKTADGKYAAIEAVITHFTKPLAEVSVLVYFNPSGSRNLQYDAHKRIPSR
jgi:hypothetical protein